MNNLGFCAMFLNGADSLMAAGHKFGSVHKAAGFNESEWRLLTQEEIWTQVERDEIGKLLSKAVSVTLRIAGLAAERQSGSYVAATICKYVAPCNRVVAAENAPESFDPLSASGLIGEPVEIICKKYQIKALVEIFSSGHFEFLESFIVEAKQKEALEQQQLMEQAS